MIKNLLYSLFLHFILLMIIYANFNLVKYDESKTSEIAVSLIALNGNETASKMEPLSGKKEKEEKASDEKLKKEIVKETKSPKKSVKNKVKKQPTKLAKSKPVTSVKKAKTEEKTKEFKEEEKEEEKQEEDKKAQEDKEKNEHRDEKENEDSKKEKELGAEKKAEEEKKANNQQDSKNNDAADAANNMENLDLSAREKFNIQSQLKRCYRRAIDESKLSSKSKVMIKVSISKNGYIESDIDEMVDMDRYNNPKDPSYKITIDNIKRAIELCSPLRNLPLDKYEIWQEAILEFDGNDKSE